MTPRATRPVPITFAAFGIAAAISAIDHPMIGEDPGKIQFYGLLDSANVDAKLVQLRERLGEMLAD